MMEHTLDRESLHETMQKGACQTQHIEITMAIFGSESASSGIARRNRSIYLSKQLTTLEETDNNNS
jgi:hypothetical protein